MGIQRPQSTELYEVVFGQNQTFRYVWRQRWNDGPLLLVSALIPSEADETKVDPTVKKCIDIAKAPHKRDGPRHVDAYGGLVVVNMFAKWPMPNNTKASRVQKIFDLVGPENDDHIRAEARKVRDDGGTVVAAWGNAGWSRHGQVLALLGHDVEEVWCFGSSESTGKTDAGFPRHAALRDTLAKDVLLKPF